MAHQKERLELLLFPLVVAISLWRSTLILACLAAWGAILTVQNLRKRDITHVSWCFIKYSGKEVDHQLVHCKVVPSL